MNRRNASAAYAAVAETVPKLTTLDEVVGYLRQAAAENPSDPAIGSALIFAELYLPGADPVMEKEKARAWAERCVPRQPATSIVESGQGAREQGRDFGELSRTGARGDGRGEAGRRLRVGYISPDFRMHTIPRLFAPILESHDRSRFEVFCYASVDEPDAMTAQLRSFADGWRDIAAMSDAEAAELIRRDRIDILVDLAGHWGGNRLRVLAHKPAPVQVQVQIGYPATTGLEAIDYRISDGHSDPPGRTEGHYVEKLERLADCAWCYTPDMNAPAVGPLPAQRAGFVTFGCLNNPLKVTDEVLETWGRILGAVPRSRLILLAPEGEKDRALLNRLKRVRIDPRRVLPVRRQPRLAYLRTFNEIDIALDPFPYNGETTTCDGFWTGVPVVAMAGECCRARRGVSHLMNVGMPELIGDGADDYVGIAVELARDVSRLARCRMELRERLRQSPLMDGKRYTRHLEDAYRRMWRVWCEN